MESIVYKGTHIIYSHKQTELRPKYSISWRPLHVIIGRQVGGNGKRIFGPL